jgi:TonB family protein
MQRSIIKKISRHSFWLSVLLHLLVLFFLFKILTTPPPEEKSKAFNTPTPVVPAYTYTGSIKPSSPGQATQNSHNPEKSTATNNEKAARATKPSEHLEKISSLNKTGDLAPSVKRMPKPKTKTAITSASLLADSFNMLKEDQLKEMTQSNEYEPIHLIGDDDAPADPLIKLIGRSLSAHFQYPHAAGQLGIKGRVIIKLTLHPEGYYSHVQMLKSSDNQDLDAAALYAVNTAPRVVGADRFISKPKRFVIGFVFK